MGMHLEFLLTFEKWNNLKLFTEQSIDLGVGALPYILILSFVFTFSLFALLSEGILSKFFFPLFSLFCNVRDDLIAVNLSYGFGSIARHDNFLTLLRATYVSPGVFSDFSFLLYLSMHLVK